MLPSETSAFEPPFAVSAALELRRACTGDVFFAMAPRDHELDPSRVRGVIHFLERSNFGFALEIRPVHAMKLHELRRQLDGFRMRRRANLACFPLLRPTTPIKIDFTPCRHGVATHG
jgi:hypothetical protein